MGAILAPQTKKPGRMVPLAGNLAKRLVKTDGAECWSTSLPGAVPPGVPGLLLPGRPVRRCLLRRVVKILRRQERLQAHVHRAR